MRPPGQEAQVTAEDYFKASVSEILLANCLSCHNPNGIAKRHAPGVRR